ncbi:hypothetical protein [Haloarchaeobius iranensis]|uniref:Uncharacterized protein n=1 Tax=Haloarchaeobius iranensis TaxID=996166 RepID=A0A1G9SXR9_9EURY|nr:hypothetical protein [Haloarchaeobius iranensis]SDM40220.1 hypothetical protein SAMN05192554_10222 [Haloarchaeobius iranensis]
MSASPYPALAPDGDGWRLSDESTEVVFDLATVRVLGATRLYEDADLRAAVREATDGALDQPWRFCFATQLSFQPPLMPGVGPASLSPTVVSSARRQFADDLRERGFRSVERHRSERMRTETGARARLTRYEAALPLTDALDGPSDRPADVAVEGWLSVWLADGQFRLAGGAYPTDGLDAVAPGVADDPGSYRNELLSVLRSA